MLEEIQIGRVRKFSHKAGVAMLCWRNYDSKNEKEGLIFLKEDQFIQFASDQKMFVEEVPKDDLLGNIGREIAYKSILLPKEMIDETFGPQFGFHIHSIIPSKEKDYDLIGLDNHLEDAHLSVNIGESLLKGLDVHELLRDVKQRGKAYLPGLSPLFYRQRLLKIERPDSLFRRSQEGFVAVIGNHSRIHFCEDDWITVFYDDNFNSLGHSVPRKVGDFFKNLPKNETIEPPIFIGDCLRG